MIIVNLATVLFLGLSVYYFILAYNKKYSPLRRKEAERYFNGSVVDDNDKEFYKERTYTKGLALSKNKKDGSVSFKKQAKMCDTAILY